ncbi:MAG TPA: VTT domain-containing protein [Pyrinomonadaceae bacterium]|jgi:membrane protein YqaA with SNARE-associated domain|nr:VTT domain-containing protein [Pyrinomonadaceae bacterium]
MFDWFHQVAQRLQAFIVGVPIYVAAPAMVLIGALDSSLLSLPEINDYLVVMRCYSDPKSVFYFPLFAALGSVIGCVLLYALMRRGGQAVLHRRFSQSNIDRVERAYARFGFLAIAVPALLPPPMPFKIFVATAGALEYPRRRFILTVMIARSLRYFIEGALAIYYGEYVIQFLKEFGFAILIGVAGVCVVGLTIYVFVRRGKPALAETDEPPPTAGGAAGGD